MAPKKLKLRKVIVLGSGALKVGEAGEFDYSGSQAVKVLREQGIKTVLVNPNIATIQTSREFVDKVYFLPITPYFVEKVIKKERPQGILLGFGGQTALNCGLALAQKDVFKKYQVRILGSPISAIRKTEDRLSFRQSIEKLGLKVPRSLLAQNLNQLKKLKDKIHYPVIIRGGFSLGGLGSAVASDFSGLEKIAQKAFSLTSQILIEEYLKSWKEIEYEVVRDKDDNTIIVCNMENLDPMGIHTGESIVVAPSQTLTNDEYHFLRQLAIKVVKSLPIIGECNIQFALNPQNGDYRIIEVNARLSRSSALASKATGYPLAYIACKLALGFSLAELPNQVTKATCAFFEPALDYVVVKIPRWDFLKFKGMEEDIGSEMQSVGEVMAIGRTFEEALQKAIRSLDLDYEGIISEELNPDKVSKRAKVLFSKLAPKPTRLYDLAYNLFYGQKPEEIGQRTGIDLWFIRAIKNIVDFYKALVSQKRKGLTPGSLAQAKKLGFSDQQIGEVFGQSSWQIRSWRKKWRITPYVCQIDTLAAEFPAKTNYLYLSYHRQRHDINGKKKGQILIIGGGPYQIGSSVEFDWCAVNTVLTARKLGYFPIMINCNPETVSTDYDISSKLYFEELTAERVLDIVDFEKCPVIVSMGGQLPNTLVAKLASQKIKILGNQPKIIDLAEDREKFSAHLDKLNIKQPVWKRLKTKKEALIFADKIGYPVLIRPSYVLSGRAMFVAQTKETFKSHLDKAYSVVTSQYPVVISKFIEEAKEVDLDGVAQKGEIKTLGISEHVEHAGVHSGDATLVLPSFSLSKDALSQIKTISQKIVQSLTVNGPFNIQFLVKENGQVPQILVIETNLRASRSFPFVSKVLGVNFIELATKIILGRKVSSPYLASPKYYGVKVPHFSFTRLRQADPVLRVEMASTGEVACFGDDLYEAYLKAILSTGFTLPDKHALLALGGEENKKVFLPAAKMLAQLGFSLYGTKSTSEFLWKNHLSCQPVHKVYDGQRPNVVDLILQKKVGLVVNLSDGIDLGVKEMIKRTTDGYLIRRAAVDTNTLLFTKASIANLFVNALGKHNLDDLRIKSWNEYVKNSKVKSQRQGGKDGK